MSKQQLRVVIYNGRSLYDTELFGTMDPYCVVRVAGNSARTRTVHNGGRNVAWQQEVSVPFTQFDQQATIQVWDEESMKRNDLVGEAAISIAHMSSLGGTWEGELQLFRKGRKPAGFVSVRVELLTMSPMTIPPPALLTPIPPTPPSSPCSAYPTASAYPNASAYPTTPSQAFIGTTVPSAPVQHAYASPMPMSYGQAPMLMGGQNLYGTPNYGMGGLSYKDQKKLAKKKHKDAKKGLVGGLAAGVIGGAVLGSLFN